MPPLPSTNGMVRRAAQAGGSKVQGLGSLLRTFDAVIWVWLVVVLQRLELHRQRAVHIQIKPRRRLVGGPHCGRRAAASATVSAAAGAGALLRGRPAAGSWLGAAGSGLRPAKRSRRLPACGEAQQAGWLLQQRAAGRLAGAATGSSKKPSADGAVCSPKERRM